MGKLLSAPARDFIDRTRIARKTAGISAKAAAAAIGVTLDEYRQFETRAELPARHVMAFCALTRISPMYLLTGERHAVSKTSQMLTAGGIVAPQNRCGAPCPLNPHWCRGECIGDRASASTH